MNDEETIMSLEHEVKRLQNLIDLRDNQLHNLRDLLKIEQRLALRQYPFRCDQIDCQRFGREVRPGDCHCENEKSRAHRAKVRAELGEMNETQSFGNDLWSGVKP